ncbi:NADH-quinone oxidoreductase subunit NuoH [Timonella sp. A28]|uniref:NADH-quinone oxidoreductase subunit NuoH n=1 Tax=Timonella sp. A28 TaxID=3442640 RepID=UPI003EBD345B
MADFSNDGIVTYIVKSVLILVFLLLSVLVAIWFERKVVGRLQVRPGPNVHGPFGLLQSLFDAMKLLLKEDITVKAADKFVYILAPMISVFCALLVFAVIPLGPEVTVPFTDIVTPLQLTDFPVATLYILACASVGVYGIVLGGWSSGSTYPLLGSVRSTAQVISYELAMGLSLVSVFIMAGSMSTSEIVASQEYVWWFLPLLPAFIIYLISMMGEVNRLPFDLPEAEGELVSGYMTEYSSMKFAWFFLAEYINMINVSAVATTLFFGGWRAPFGLGAINDGMFNEGWWGLLWFLLKMWTFMFIFVWVRGTLLRFRYDQFMSLGWKVLIPFALAWIFVLAFFQGLQSFLTFDARPFLFGAAAIAFVVLMVTIVVDVRATKRAPARDPHDHEEATFDAFAGGYPVPPLPGQALPPSPRASRTKTATATVNQLEVATDVTTRSKEANDE